VRLSGVSVLEAALVARGTSDRQDTKVALDTEHKRAILERIERIPIVRTLSLRICDLGRGTCRATVPRDTCYDGVFESFHGGLLMTIADSVACFAVMTLTSPDQILTTTDMSICFLEPCLSNVTAEAEVIKLGRSLCPVSVDLFDAEGKKVAVAHVKYIRLSRMPGRL